MITVKAKLNLYRGKDKRQTPFTSNYRPLFEFVEGMKTSGQITLVDKQEFRPGEDGIVTITFLNEKYLGEDFRVGKTVKFYEGKESLGEVEIIELL